MKRSIPVEDPAMPEEGVPSRRIVLRGVAATACGLFLPAALWGCQKQEAEVAGEPSSEPGSEPEATPPQTAAPEAAAPAAAAKVSKASVQYQTEPKGDQQCGGCLHFIAESNTCKLVEGDISPNGWCQLWAKKA